jgi:hypothetical protein
MAKKTSIAEGSVCAPLSRICSLSKRNEKGVRDFSEGFLLLLFTMAKTTTPRILFFYDGRERRVKLIRVCSEFEFSVNLNFIPTSFFISLLPLSPQLIVQLIRFVGFISPFRELFLHALPVCVQSTEGSFKKKKTISPFFFIYLD